LEAQIILGNFLGNSNLAALNNRINIGSCVISYMSLTQSGTIRTRPKALEKSGAFGLFFAL
jgi:hypothetical protein